MDRFEYRVPGLTFSFGGVRFIQPQDKTRLEKMDEKVLLITLTAVLLVIVFLVVKEARSGKQAEDQKDNKK